VGVPAADASLFARPCPDSGTIDAGLPSACALRSCLSQLVVDACFDKLLPRHCRGGRVTRMTLLGIAVQARAIVNYSTITRARLLYVLP
jgi:hypothetical protein